MVFMYANLRIYGMVVSHNIGIAVIFHITFILENSHLIHFMVTSIAPVVGKNLRL